MTQCSFPTEKAMGGWNNLCVTQKLVDAYYMVDGRDKNDASKEYPYHVANGTVTDDYFSTSAEEFSGYTIPMGVYWTVSKPRESFLCYNRLLRTLLGSTFQYPRTIWPL